MISHGASTFLNERLFQVSDPFRIMVCQDCGTMSSSQKECQSCKSNRIRWCNMPYSGKLLLTELIGGIGLKMQLQPGTD